MYLIITFIVGIFIWFMFRQIGSAPSEIEGKASLKFHVVFTLFGLLCMALGLFVPLQCFFIDRDFSSEAIIAAVILFSFFFGMGFWIFTVSKNHFVIYDDNEIKVINSNKDQKTFRWADIEDLQFNGWKGKYVLTLKSGEKVSMHQYMTGIAGFIKRMEGQIKHNQL